jgi:hypothetical protein
MKAIRKAAACSSIFLALTTSAFAQGTGGAGGGRGGGTGSGNSGGQGAGMSRPNAGGTTGSVSTSKGSDTMKPQTGTSQSNRQAKGATDGAASSAQ